MLATALAHHGPAALRYPRAQGQGVDLSAPPQVLPLGQGRTMREGSDLTLLALGNLVTQALAAAEQLADSGLSVAVVDARFAKPLDAELIMARARQGPLVTVEENVLAGGFGAAVAELLEDRGVTNVRLCRLGLPDRFIDHGKTAQLWAEASLDAAGIVATARKLVGAP